MLQKKNWYIFLKLLAFEETFVRVGEAEFQVFLEICECAIIKCVATLQNMPHTQPFAFVIA